MDDLRIIWIWNGSPLCKPMDPAATRKRVLTQKQSQKKVDKVRGCTIFLYRETMRWEYWTGLALFPSVVESLVSPRFEF